MELEPFRELVEREVVVERDGWAGAQAIRVTRRLQRGVPDAAQLDTLVIWTDEHEAFTGPGRTIYIGRRLLERLPDDDAVAFVVAHELAHHRLGHVPARWPSWFRLPVAIAVAILRNRIATAEREQDADLLAIELCLEAGYDPERCVVALEILYDVALDYRNLTSALGREDGRIARDRHHPLRLRIDAARAHADAYRAGRRISLDLTRDRERRRRKVALAAAGGAALTLALLVLRRRP